MQDASITTKVIHERSDLPGTRNARTGYQNIVCVQCQWHSIRIEIGDLMIITDHINYFPEHPLRGQNILTAPLPGYERSIR